MFCFPFAPSNSTTFASKGCTFHSLRRPSAVDCAVDANSIYHIALIGFVCALLPPLKRNRSALVAPNTLSDRVGKTLNVSFLRIGFHLFVYVCELGVSAGPEGWTLPRVCLSRLDLETTERVSEVRRTD